VLDEGADDARRRLRTERPRLGFLGPGHDPEQLLLDDVGHVADAAFEYLGLLDERRLDLAVAVPSSEVGGRPLEARPGGPFGGQDVAGPAWRLEARHRRRV
jgi:hypothetical protein